jgi:hypothetical protein
MNQMAPMARNDAVDERPPRRCHPDYLRAHMRQLNAAINHRTHIIDPALDLEDDATVARALTLMIVEVAAMQKALEDLLAQKEGDHG